MKSAGEDSFEKKQPFFELSIQNWHHIYIKKNIFSYLFIFILSISHCQGLFNQTLYMVCDCIV